MCLSDAGRIRAIDGAEAVVDVDGADRRVSLAPIVLAGDPVEVGDWVLVHTGLAVEVLDPDAARDLAAFSRQIRQQPEEGL
jgi:hydrogenase expression/formation protein HypC